MNLQHPHLTPIAKAIIAYLAQASTPQSLTDIAAGAKSSYWGSRVLAHKLVAQGILSVEKQSGCPFFSLLPEHHSYQAVSALIAPDPTARARVSYRAKAQYQTAAVAAPEVTGHDVS
jgi:hypothetical protein